MERIPMPDNLVTTFDLVKGALGAIYDAIKQVRVEPADHVSNHYRGGVAQLDASLYDKPNRWDDQGRYYEDL